MIEIPFLSILRLYDSAILSEGSFIRRTANLIFPDFPILKSFTVFFLVDFLDNLLLNLSQDFEFQNHGIIVKNLH